MRRVIAVLACSLGVAACSEKVPGLNIVNAAPPKDEVAFESEPAGAEVKTATGQTCRTPCELTVEVAAGLPVTFSLDGYEPQAVSLRAVPSQPIGTPRFQPNPVHVELRAVPVPPPPIKKPVKRKPAVAARANKPAVATEDPGAPPAATFVNN